MLYFLLVYVICTVFGVILMGVESIVAVLIFSAILALGFTWKEMSPTEKRIMLWICIIAFVIALISFVIMLMDSPSSSNSEPWKDLGVSEKEYRDIYNYYDKQYN